MDKKHDAYCWKCCGIKTTLKCSTCIRSFHIGCTIDKNTDENNFSAWLDSWCCSVCNNLNTSKNTPMELETIPIIIDSVWVCDYVDLNKKKIMKRRKSKCKTVRPFIKCEEDVFSVSDVIVNPIDLSKIKDKAESYVSLDEFLTDIEWIVHNCEILFTEGHEKTKRAKDLLKKVAAEIDSVRKCLQCHMNANAKETRSRWFSMVCDVPHLIVWAHRKCARYWPAKIMSIEGQEVNVRFFGSFHKHENVPIDKCYLYSVNSPGKMRPSKSIDRWKNEFVSARKEADQYIANIRRKYGGFHFAEVRTPFESEKYDEYIRDLMSGIRTPSQNKVEKIAPKREEREVRKATVENCGNSEDPVQIPTVEQPSASVESVPLIKIERVFEAYVDPNAVETDTNFDIDDFPEIENDVLMTSNNNLGPSLIEDNLDATNSVSDFDDSIQNFTKDFDRISQELKKRLENSEKRHETDVKRLKETNTKLVAENKKLKVDTENKIDELKKTHNQEIIALKAEHKKQFEAYKSNVENNEKQKQAVEQCIKEYSLLIVDAKKNKYCDGCGSAKPLDIYVCSVDCQRICWERAAKKNGLQLYAQGTRPES